MIAFAPRASAQVPVRVQPAWQAGYLALLPDIRRHLRFAFRQLPIESREEAMQEALALALVAYLRLHALGKTDVAYATPLANYAARQVRAGRRMACPLNACDVLSPYAQRQQGFAVDRLQGQDREVAAWKELLIV